MSRMGSLHRSVVVALIVLISVSACGVRDSQVSVPVDSTQASTSAVPSSSPSESPVESVSPTPSVTVTQSAKPTVGATTAAKPQSSTTPKAKITPTPTATSSSSGFPNPKPVVPAVIQLGATYPWFPVAVGKLAEPWGVSGELVYADEFVTVIRTRPNEMIIARDLYSLRGAWRVVGVTSAKVTKTNERTFVRLFCNDREVSGAGVSHYNTATVNPASLQVQYVAEIDVSEFECP